LGEADIKTVEDLAGCATDDLVGWAEKKQNETVRHKGAFSDLDVAAQEAEAIIMAARVKAGWIEETVAEAPAAEAGESAEAGQQA
jgi:N utilization substance protein A